MPWVDLHKGVLEEFVSRHLENPQDVWALYGGEGFLISIPIDDRDSQSRDHYFRNRDVIREKRKARYRTQTPEQIAKQNLQARARKKSMTQEQRDVHNLRKREYRKRLALK